MPALPIFAALCVASIVAEHFSRVAPAPALLFVYGFLGPLSSFYYATYRLWPTGQALALSRTIVVLGVLQFVVIGLFDLPTFLASRNPDDIVGTFGGERLSARLLPPGVRSARLLGSPRSRPSPVKRRPFAIPLLPGATFLVIFLAQYRALLIFSALAVLLIGFMLSAARGRGFVVGATVVIAFIAALGYVSAKYPTFKLPPTIEAVREDPMSFVTARFDPGRDVISLYGDDLVVRHGYRTGTYSSRAWRTFAEVGKASALEGAAQPYATALAGGKAYHTDVWDRYVIPRLETAPIVLGSAAVTSPFSSYLALFAEVGVLGLALILVCTSVAFFEAGRHRLRIDSLRASQRSAAGSGPRHEVAFFLLPADGVPGELVGGGASDRPELDDAGGLQGVRRARGSPSVTKPRLIVIGPLPPPIHGVTVSTSLVLEKRRAGRHLRNVLRHVNSSDHPRDQVGTSDAGT